MCLCVCVAYLIYYREINFTHSYKIYKVIENNPKLKSLYLPSSLPLFVVLMFMKAVIGLWPHIMLLNIALQCP